MLPAHLVSKFFLGSLALVAISLPFTKNLNSWAIGLLAVSWLLEGNFGGKWKRLKQHRWWWTLLAFFALHAVALFYTDDPATGSFVLEKKSGLWLVPLLVLTGPFPTGFQPIRIVRLFALSATLGALYCLIAGTLDWWQSGELTSLSHHGLSAPIGMNAIYLSAFLVFSFFVAAHWVISDGPDRPGRYTGLVIFAMAVQLIALVFLASKTLLIVLFLVGNVGLLGWIIRTRKWNRGLLFLLGNLVLIGGIASIPETRERFSELLNTEPGFALRDDYRHDTPFTGLSLRVTIWQIGAELLTEQQTWPLGNGPGDSQALLDSAYQAHGMYTGNPDLEDRGYLGYNLHNQFVQTVVDLGVLGLTTLLFVLGWLFRRAWRDRNDLAGLLLILIFFFSLTESTLEAHHGSVFFALMISLLLVQKPTLERPTGASGH